MIWKIWSEFVGALSPDEFGLLLVAVCFAIAGFNFIKEHK